VLNKLQNSIPECIKKLHAFMFLIHNDRFYFFNGTICVFKFKVRVDRIYVFLRWIFCF